MARCFAIRLALLAGAFFAAEAVCGRAGSCLAVIHDGDADEASMLQRSHVHASDELSVNQVPLHEHQKNLGNSIPYLPKWSVPTETLTGTAAGAIQINEDGVLNTYYLPGATVINETTLQLTPPYRYYLMNTPQLDDGNPGAYYMPIFPGKTFTVDINFGPDGPSCGCNINFYLVNGPASSPGTYGDYYCDAQCTPGLGCCAEFDMLEGNINVQQTTNHACDGPYTENPTWQCNAWGDPLVQTAVSQFGAGSNHTIDSTQPYTFSQEFAVEGNNMLVTTTLTQGNNSVVLPMGENNQTSAMMEVMQSGMVFVTGYWSSSSMNWLDSGACGNGPEICNNQPAYISNWRITTNAQ